MRILFWQKHVNEDRLSDYISGRLSAGQQARLERQLQRCAHCRHELGSLLATRSLVRSLPSPELPRSLVFSEAPAPSPEAAKPVRNDPPWVEWARRSPGWAYAGAAAVGVVAVMLVVFAGVTDAWLPGEGGGQESALALAQQPPVAEMALEGAAEEHSQSQPSGASSKTGPIRWPGRGFPGGPKNCGRACTGFPGWPGGCSRVTRIRSSRRDRRWVSDPGKRAFQLEAGTGNRSRGGCGYGGGCRAGAPSNGGIPGTLGRGN